MSNWKEYRLSDLIDIIGGGTPKTSISEYWNGNIPWLSVVDFGNQNKFVANTEKHITELGLNNSSTKILKSGQIIISARGTVGELAVLRCDMAFNQSCYGLNAINSVCNNDFLYYLLKCKIEELKKNAHGAVFDTITRATFETISAYIPDLPSQTIIAEILSSLDDKIELNTQINSELEALAQVLFKQWFVDFEFPDENGLPYKSSGGKMVDSELGEIPEVWSVDSIYKISDVINGAPFKSSLFNQEKKGLPLIRIRDLKTYKPQFWTDEKHVKGTIIKPGDLIVGMDAEFRPHFWLGQNAWLNQRLCQFKSKKGYSRLFVREIIRPQLAFFENSSVGTTVIHLGKGDIDSFKSIIPTEKLLNEFEYVSEPIVENIVNNSIENESLKNLRDILLPKLISGELEVSEVLAEKQ